MTLTTPAMQSRVARVERAAWRLLGAARDLPADVDALAHALHDQECECGGEPDDETWIRASGLVQAGWRRSGTTMLSLATLLDEIAKAWQSASVEPISPCEAMRWTKLVVVADRMATEIVR